MENPLLTSFELPPFDQIEEAHVEPAITKLLDDIEGNLPALESSVAPTWEGSVEKLTDFEEPLSSAWGVIQHLNGVKNTPALREAYQNILPRVVQVSMRIAQSEAIFSALRALRESEAWTELDEGQQRIIEHKLRGARLSGIELEGEERKRYNEIQQELSELSTTFSNHVLDATKAWAMTLTSPDDVAGLPQSALEMAAQAARAAGDEGATASEGPWRFSLDIPSFLPLMKHAHRRELREKMYRAYVQRASSGEHDNGPLMRRILELRKEQAALLGFSTYADLSLESKMAPDVAQVENLLDELAGASRQASEQDLADLRALAKEGVDGFPGDEELRNWDVEFLSERLRERRFDFTDEEIRPYFPLPRVLDGLFALVERLFGIRVKAADGEATLWHPDVRFFRIEDKGGEPLAAFFLDPFSRPENKRGGAWMAECVGRRRKANASELRLPVAYLVCNQTPPVGDTPSLMTFREVETLFHEFGHGLQHMLTQVDWPDAAGISGVEWDAVELPSQFMENWCYHRETLLGMARHYETGEVLPEVYFEKLRAARTFRAGSAMLRQIHFARTDLELHHRFDPLGSVSPYDVQQNIARETLVMQPLPEDRFLAGFGHIFAGGYAAGYYSYKWAEVLSADAFAAFEEAGLENADALEQTGARFRETVLGLGGSREPMQVFVDFRGRAPSTEALLRHNELIS